MKILRSIGAAAIALCGLVACGSGGNGGGCGGAEQGGEDSLAVLYEARYAGRFALLSDAEGRRTVLRVFDPWQGAEGVTYDYRLVEDTSGKRTLGPGEIRWPVRSAVCMSSSHVAFLDAVGAVGVIRGVSGRDFVANPAVHREGVREVGYDTRLDYETIVALRPDVVFVYGLAGENEAAETLRRLGVPVLYVADYLEQEPLGRAEWIVPFGLLVDKLDEAVGVFMEVEEAYKTLGERVAVSVDGEKRPKVMLNAPYKDVWYLPGDRSYLVRLLDDAGGDYLGRGDDSDRSRPVSAEQALRWMARADYWLNPGQATTMAQLRADNRRFESLPVVRRGRVYNNNARITPHGGSDFWESGAVSPDIVLADLV
ncbi:MAG: ABC transporter substrate-binding protein, partial [Rikenella sp.]|nr:ABC transporter substrate-binding protein [Rikenella sp.]